MDITYHLKTDVSSLHTREFLHSDVITQLYTEYTAVDAPLDADTAIKVFNKEVHIHRRMGFFSDTSIGYKFSGQVSKAQALPNNLRALLDRVNRTLNTEFNGILVNHYRDGTDYVGAHSDSESGLSNGVVAAISVGAVRIFRIRRKDDNKIVLDIPTISGELLVMDGKFQQEFKHEIPIQKRIKTDRVSFTFRKHSI